LTQEHERSKEDAAHLRGLNEQLESDLLHIQTSAVAVPTPSEGVDPLEGLNLGTSSPSTRVSTDSKPNNGPISFAPSADTSILPIVTSQRDRFRKRNAELEEVSDGKLRLSEHEADNPTNLIDDRNYESSSL
jgi:homeobox protein cut-like